jgi:hypothetical protein
MTLNNQIIVVVMGLTFLAWMNETDAYRILTRNHLDSQVSSLEDNVKMNCSSEGFGSRVVGHLCSVTEEFVKSS